MNKLKTWMAEATTEQQQELAQAAGTSRQYLYQAGSGHRTPSAALGGAIEAATRRMAKRTGLPVVTRGDLVPACAGCSYFKQCRGKA